MAEAVVGPDIPVVGPTSVPKDNTPPEDGKRTKPHKQRKKNPSSKNKKAQNKSSESSAENSLIDNIRDDKSPIPENISVSVSRNGKRTLHHQQSPLPNQDSNPAVLAPTGSKGSTPGTASSQEKTCSTQQPKAQPEKEPKKNQIDQGKKTTQKNKSRNNNSDMSKTPKVKNEKATANQTAVSKTRISPDVKSKEAESNTNTNNQPPADKVQKERSSVDRDKKTKNDKEFREKLEKNFIFPLKKKSTMFPRAIYFCRICSYHLHVDEDCRKHMKEERHQRRKMVEESLNILHFIPEPTKKQLEALNTLLGNVYQEHSLTEEEVKERKSLVMSVEKYVKEMIPETEMKLYGSSVSGFGLKTSDVNIYVHSPNNKCSPKLLVSVYELLKKSGDRFRNVTTDFYSKVPGVTFEDPDSKLHCLLTINSCFSRDTSHLLNIYSTIDIRAKQLGIALRIWAKLCCLDQQTEGTLPAYSLSLMTVYYLQNTNPPVLPIFHKNFPSVNETDENKKEWFDSLREEAGEWKTKNTQSLSELWLGLLRFYVLEFDPANQVISIRNEKVSGIEKKWKNRRFTIEDPFNSKLNVARTVTGRLIHEYLQDTLRKTYLYFALPRDEKRQSLVPIDILEKIAGECALKEYRQKESNSENSSSETTNVNNRGLGSADGGDLVDEPAAIDPSGSTMSDIVSTSNTDSSNCDEPSQSVSVDSPTPSSVSEKSFTDITSFSRDFAEKIISNAMQECKSLCAENCQRNSKEDSPDRVKMGRKAKFDLASLIDLESLQTKDCFYEFSKNVLSDGKGLPIICSFCESEGHLRKNCPEDTLPVLRPLPNMTSKHLSVLSETIKNVIYDFAPRQKDIMERKWILKNLEGFIRDKLYPDACLQLFGSSCNGFGFSKSDLDICLTFKDKTSEGLDYSQVIKSLANQLEKHCDLCGITAITSAKVPIVKFRHKLSGLEGDISLYNTLAQHNTTLLETYSLIDERVSILGYAFKVFAKICKIGDASMGSLSSYAYVLMLLHYLQQCEPPVIPVLQELHSDTKPELMVEGWNVWFFKDLKALPSVWPGYKKNTESIGELWLGLFKYYSMFPVKGNVITIRQKAPLTCFEKLWIGECLAIEDPFDLSHNLGSGLSKKMNNYILHALIHARELYGTPFESIPHLTCRYRTSADYFFDPYLLTEGRPPNDRGCRECGKIGHIAKKCPLAIQRKKDKEARHKEDRQRREQNRGNERGKEEYVDRSGGRQTSNKEPRHRNNSYTEYPRDRTPLLPSPAVYTNRGKEEYEHGMRQSPNKEPRIRNNSYSEYPRDRAPLLPTPVMRTRTESHSGSRSSPQPLMDIEVGGKIARQTHQPHPQHHAHPYNYQQVLRQDQTNPPQQKADSSSTELPVQQEQIRVNSSSSELAANQQVGKYVMTPSGCRVFVPTCLLSSPQKNVAFMIPPQTYPNMTYGYPPTSVQQQQQQQQQQQHQHQQQQQPSQPPSNQPNPHQGQINGSQNFNLRNNAPVHRNKNYYVQQ